MKTLGEVFNPYLADKPLADDISSAELLKLNINKYQTVGRKWILARY